MCFDEHGTLGDTDKAVYGENSEEYKNFKGFNYFG